MDVQLTSTTSLPRVGHLEGPDLYDIEQKPRYSSSWYTFFKDDSCCKDMGKKKIWSACIEIPVFNCVLS